MVKKEKKKSNKPNFFREVKGELSKVTWPTSKNMFKYTIATLVTVVFFGAYFYGINVLFAFIKGLFN